jgi:hypothetical protein
MKAVPKWILRTLGIMVAVALLGSVVIYFHTLPASAKKVQAAAPDPAMIPWDGKSDWIKDGEIVWQKIGNQGIARFVLVATEKVPAPRTQEVSCRVMVVPLDKIVIPQRARENRFGGPESDVEISATLMRGGMSGQVIQDNVLVPPWCLYKGKMLRIAEPEFDIGP